MRLKIRSVPLQHLSHQRAALFGRHVGQAHESCVSTALDEENVPEVCIDRYKDAAVLLGTVEKGSIAGIGTKLTGFNDIMSRVSEPLSQASACTTIDQELQRPAARTRSIWSFAMAALAYSRQARMSSGSRSG